MLETSSIVFFFPPPAVSPVASYDCKGAIFTSRRGRFLYVSEGVATRSVYPCPSTSAGIHSLLAVSKPILSQLERIGLQFAVAVSLFIRFSTP
jgi:hypothetical protein